jgi:hypothetical protein
MAAIVVEKGNFHKAAFKSRQGSWSGATSTTVDDSTSPPKTFCRRPPYKHPDAAKVEAVK